MTRFERSQPLLILLSGLLELPIMALVAHLLLRFRPGLPTAGKVER